MSQSHLVTAAEPWLRAALELSEHGQIFAVLQCNFCRVRNLVLF